MSDVVHCLPFGVKLLNGKYQIKSVLGQGTFGITYLASAKSKMEGNLGTFEFEAEVAVKEFFLRDFNQRDEASNKVEGSSGNYFTDYRRRFRREATNLTKLSHPGIVKVLEVFDENGTTYYAMECIKGETLDEYIRCKGNLSEIESIAIIREVGAALAYMHSKQILHLDIKPKNIMRKDDGTFRIIDFGLSKAFGVQGESESSSNIGLGTPGYAPLEQASYKKDGTFPATLDVYALGATFFKMLTGETPPEPTVILNQGFPADRLLRHNVSPRVVDVIRKTMELAKVNRYQSVNEFLVALYGDNDVTAVNDVTSSYPDSTSDEPQQQPVFIADFSDEEPYPVTLDSLPDDAPSADTSDSVVNPQTPQSSVSPEPEVLPEDNKSGFPVWLIIIGVAVILGAVCFAYFSTDDTSTSPQSENVDTVSDVNSQTPPDKVTDMLWKSDVGDAKYSGSVMTVSRDGVDQTVPHGTGKAVFVSGDNKGRTYEGDFVEGVIQGNGVFYFADGSRFAGEFDNNQFKKGRYTEKSSGKYYVGTFKNMQPDQGDWFNKDGQPI